MNFSRGRTPVQCLAYLGPCASAVFDHGPWIYGCSLEWDTPPKKVKSNVSVIPYLLGSYVEDFEEGTAAEWKGRVGGSKSSDHFQPESGCHPQSGFFSGRRR